MLKFAGILALVGGAANLVVGCVVFAPGIDFARWLVCGGLEPDPRAADLPIPLLIQVATAVCGMAAGIALLTGRGAAAKLASASLVVVGITVLYARNIFGVLGLREVSNVYARHGSLLVACGLISATLPGVMAALALAPRRVDARPLHAATT